MHRGGGGRGGGGGGRGGGGNLVKVESIARHSRRASGTRVVARVQRQVPFETRVCIAVIKFFNLTPCAWGVGRVLQAKKNAPSFSSLVVLLDDNLMVPSAWSSEWGVECL